MFFLNPHFMVIIHVGPATFKSPGHKGWGRQFRGKRIIMNRPVNLYKKLGRLFRLTKSSLQIVRAGRRSYSARTWLITANYFKCFFLGRNPPSEDRLYFRDTLFDHALSRTRSIHGVLVLRQDHPERQRLFPKRWCNF